MGSSEIGVTGIEGNTLGEGLPPPFLHPTTIGECDLNLTSPLERFAAELTATLTPRRTGGEQFLTLRLAGFLDLDDLVREIDEHPPRPLSEWGKVNCAADERGTTYFDRFGILPVLEREGNVMFALRAEGTGGTFRAPIEVAHFLRDNFALRVSQRGITIGKPRFIVLNDDDFATLAAVTYDATARLEFLGGIDPDAAAQKVRDKTFVRAIESRASDIHIEPHAGEYRVRARVDGDLQTFFVVKRDTGLALVNKIWRESRSPEEDPRKPGDAKVIFTPQDRARIPLLEGYSLRLSRVPVTTEDGGVAPKLVLRFLTQRTEHGLDIAKLGLRTTVHAQILEIMRSPFGIFIVTGPTGSGKSTTLYSMVRKLNNERVHILTVEDPVEVKLRGINQMSVNKKIDFDFTAAMRAALRQDPDVMLIGEIRDEESARIALQAAKTGHFVLTTLHTNNALEAVSRLRDWGLDAADVGMGLRGLMAQRLVKTLCKSCCESCDGREEFQSLFPDGVEGETSDALFGEPFEVRRPSAQSRACKECRGTGYLGRTVVPEVVTMNDEIRSLIASREQRYERLEEAALKTGYVPMGIQALQLIRDGVTSIEEGFRFFAPSDLRRHGALIRAVMQR